MNHYRMNIRLATASALSLGLLLAGSLASAADAPGNHPQAPGYGPGMMDSLTPDQRQQHWEQMQQGGYGPGSNLTPEQRQQQWEQMHQGGYGPGMMGSGQGGMMGVPAAAPPAARSQ